jgi:hypothetical protein
MFLLYGPADRWNDAFADEREVYEAWNQHRAQILSYYRNGRRPWAWWALEAGELRFPGQTRERAVLYEAGLLGEEERAELVAHWRARFVQAQQPGFMFCVGFAKPSDTTATWLKGAPARRRAVRTTDGQGFRVRSCRSGRRSAGVWAKPSVSSMRRHSTRSRPPDKLKAQEEVGSRSLS